MDEKLIYFYEKKKISLFNFLDTVGVSIFMTISFNVKSMLSMSSGYLNTVN